MSRLVFFSSLTLCLLALALTRLPDPGIFGFGDESGRILFYGGSGLLAGLFGLGALISAFLQIATSSAKSRYLVAILLTFSAMVAVIFLFRVGWL